MLHLFIAAVLCGQVAVTDDELDAYYKAEKAKPPSERQHPLLSFSTIRTDHVGLFPYAYDSADPKPYVSTKIAKILSDSDLAVEVTIWGWERRSFPSRIVGQPGITGNVPVKRDSLVVLVSGIGTRDSVDGMKIRLPGGFRCAGTHQLKTSDGDLTVWKLVPRDLPILVTPEEEKQAAAKLSPDTRKWSTKDGKFSTLAEYVSHDAKEVQLRKVDGKVVSVKLHLLSNEDLRWIRNWGTKAGK